MPKTAGLIGPHKCKDPEQIHGCCSLHHMLLIDQFRCAVLPVSGLVLRYLDFQQLAFLSQRCRWPLTNFTMYAVNQWLFVLIALIACFGCFLLFAWIRRRGHKKATHSLFPLLLPFPFPFSCLIFSSIAT